MANVAAKPDAAAGQTPQNHSQADDEPARDPIGEQTENRCADHVSYEKCDAQQTGLGHGVYVVSCEKSCANIRLERGQNLPVNVIEKINGQQKKESGARAAHGFAPTDSIDNCRLQFAARRL